MPSFITTAAKYGVTKPRKLLHIGANYGQEARSYAALGIEAWHIEAIPNVFSILSKNIAGLAGQHAVHACLSREDGQEVSFNIANNEGQSSSLLDLGRHAVAYPTVKYVDTVKLPTRSVDSLVKHGEIPSDIDFILIDAQGAELMILEGARGVLSAGNVAGMLVETAVEPLYENGATYLQIGGFLQTFDLHLCQAIFNVKGWTDALYARPYWRRAQVKIDTTGENIALRAKTTQSSVYALKEPLSAFTGLRTGSYTFHTERERNPWIKLSFRSEQSFHEILLFNRLDTCMERSRNIDILVSSDDKTWALIHENHEIFGGIDGNPLRISCPGMRAKHILFRLRDENYLHLDQIEVYA